MNIAMSLPTGANQLMKAKHIIDRFIYNCSHRLRSPLASIEGLVMLAGHCNDPLELNQCLILIQQCTLNMLDMIAKLEDYTAVQNRQLSTKTIDTDNLVQKVVGEFEKQIEEHDIFILTNIIQPINWIGDEECVYLILKHLLYNSIAYSDKKKKVRKVCIKISVNAEEVTIEIIDNGIGVPTAEKEKIFDPFHRSSSQGNGNGLGLFVVKGIVEKLKANISVHTADSIGTSFLITIPNNTSII